MCDEKIKEMQELEAELAWLIGPEMSREQKKGALENSFWRARNAGYCDYMAGQRMAGVDDGQVQQHNLDCKYKYEVERLLDLLEEQKNEEIKKEAKTVEKTELEKRLESGNYLSENGLPVGAGLEDLGKGLCSMTGTIHSTKQKGVRYLSLTEGYILELGLDKNDQVIGYKFVNLGKVMDAIKKGVDAKEAYEKNIGTYGRFADAVKTIDPREAQFNLLVQRFNYKENKNGKI